MKHDKPEKVHILAAMVDIIGSGVCQKRIADADKDILPFWRKFDEAIDGFEVRHEYFVKHLGDGFLAVLKLNGKKGVQAMRFLNEFRALKKKMDKLAKVRIHVASGEAIQKKQTNGELVFHGRCLDLIGTTVKIEELTKVPFIVHRTVMDLMSPIEVHEGRFGFHPIMAPRVLRAAQQLYRKDMAQLYELVQ